MRIVLYMIYVYFFISLYIGISRWLIISDLDILKEIFIKRFDQFPQRAVNIINNNNKCYVFVGGAIFNCFCAW